MSIIILMSFPTAESCDEYSANKVPGIKAVRQMSGLSLKEALNVIEDLREKVSYTFEMESTNSNTEALKTFVELGGTYIVNSLLSNSVRTAVDDALNLKQYGTAIELITILKSVK